MKHITLTEKLQKEKHTTEALSLLFAALRFLPIFFFFFFAANGVITEEKRIDEKKCQKRKTEVSILFTTVWLCATCDYIVGLSYS